MAFASWHSRFGGAPAMLWPVLVLLLGTGHACTNFIVSRGATADQSTIFANTADAGGLHGALPHFPAAKHAPGAKRKLYGTDTGRFLGEIDEAEETYNVIGNLNEHGVAIGETRFGGHPTLAGGEGVMDYGNLIWVTLQRTKTAAQAVQMFGELVERYGYISEGVSFTIADPAEAWILEMIGKGKAEKGAIWVAVRIPDGHVSGHAGEARIQRFPLNAPLDCMYSKDVISFAGKVGLWDSSLQSEHFSFAEVYDPIAFAAADRSDSRIWAFFAVVGDDPTLAEAFAKQVSMGGQLKSRSRLPLSIAARSKISVLDLMKHMRNHYNGTSLYQQPAIGMLAPEDAESAWRKNWQYGNSTVVHPRHEGTQEGGWNFVAQLRGHFPAPIGGLLWFGIDDATFTVHIPIHGGTTRVPEAFQGGDETYWAFNAAAQFINPRWSLAPSILQRAHAMEDSFHHALLMEEWKAWQLYQVDQEKAMEVLTQQEEQRASNATKAEIALLSSFMTRYRRRNSLRGTASLARSGSNTSAADVVELKVWFAKMEKEARAMQDGRLKFGEFAAEAPSTQHAERRPRNIQTLSRGAFAALASVVASAVLAFMLVRLRPQYGQQTCDAAQEPLVMEEPLAMDASAISDAIVE